MKMNLWKKPRPLLKIYPGRTNLINITEVPMSPLIPHATEGTTLPVDPSSIIEFSTPPSIPLAPSGLHQPLVRESTHHYSISNIVGVAQTHPGRPAVDDLLLHDPANSLPEATNLDLLTNLEAEN